LRRVRGRGDQLRHETGVGPRDSRSLKRSGSRNRHQRLPRGGIVPARNIDDSPGGIDTHCGGVSNWDKLGPVRIISQGVCRNDSLTVLMKARRASSEMFRKIDEDRRKHRGFSYIAG